MLTELVVMWKHDNFKCLCSSVTPFCPVPQPC